MNPPLCRADLRVRRTSHYPLDVQDFLTGDAALLPDRARMASLRLRVASWSQVPAGSLPNDPSVLARAAGFGRNVAAWLAVASDALIGWLSCDDGRTYHAPTVAMAVAEDALFQSRHDRTVAARVARQSRRVAKAGSVTEDRVSVTDAKSLISGKTASEASVSVTENRSQLLGSVTETAAANQQLLASVTENATVIVQFPTRTASVTDAKCAFRQEGGDYRGGWSDVHRVDAASTLGTTPPGRLHHPEGVQGEPDHDGPDDQHEEALECAAPAVDAHRSLALTASLVVADRVMEWPDDTGHEASPVPAATAKPKAKRAKSDTRRCAEEEPWTDAMARHATKWGMPEHLWTLEFERFRIHHVAKANRFTDWNLVWCKWCSNGFWKNSPEYRDYLRATGALPGYARRENGVTLLGDHLRRMQATATTPTETHDDQPPAHDEIDWNEAYARHASRHVSARVG